jgi:hypothetical protein
MFLAALSIIDIVSSTVVSEPTILSQFGPLKKHPTLFRTAGAVTKIGSNFKLIHHRANWEQPINRSGLCLPGGAPLHN